MARYTGPKNRIARRFGVNIFGRARNPLIHKQNPPGMHGARHKKKSDFGLQLEEKQKLRAFYGMISQKQLVTYYQRSLKHAGKTAENFLHMLECRLDNVVLRLKLANTIFAAQQLVSHGHIEVNGKKVDIRSFQVKPGMLVSLKEKSRNLECVKRSIADARGIPEFLQSEQEGFAGRLLALPFQEQVPFPLTINIPMICEFLAHTN